MKNKAEIYFICRGRECTHGDINKGICKFEKYNHSLGTNSCESKNARIEAVLEELRELTGI
jgi:hypothetical protein